MSNYVLVTGGAGYIGSHSVVALIEAGYNPIVLDNFSNSSKESISGIEKICGAGPVVIEGDVGNSSLLMNIFSSYNVNSVLHFSGLKSVEESTAEPLKYYSENVGSSLSLLRAMQEAKVQKLIFSSSATVYNPESQLPYTEKSPTKPINPYGQTKLCIEQILHGLADVNPKWRIGILRYFNPVGAHPSGHIGEDPKQQPNNLMPLIMQTAVGRREKLLIYGDDYDTPDGTCIRDYIHVSDLARGHLSALRYLDKHEGLHIWNLGTGKGTSVQELIKKAREVTGAEIKTEIRPKRSGDSPEAVADPKKAKDELLWHPEYSIGNMCADHWNWQRQNPDGYQ
ncbi:MAG: UDP-glucose 4-epimerase GalE [Acidimicrobiaceae bacterium]|nr:UDP-glucose 4-epimerase GalE [Acidimicrobiaceae bacterium]